jgi:uncharacterized membrane protein
VSTSRLEAFSDGVIAIAITLLVLDITVPVPGSAVSLAHALGQQWPHYAAYAVSFLTIGVIWINHHAMVRRLASADHSILFLNLVLLMTIAVLPFTTALMADYLREADGQHLAAAVYGGSFLVMGLAFYGMQHHILFNRRDLLVPGVDDAARVEIARRNRVGLVPYAIATAFAPLSAYLTLAICAALALYYALPQPTHAGTTA